MSCLPYSMGMRIYKQVFSLSLFFLLASVFQVPATPAAPINKAAGDVPTPTATDLLPLLPGKSGPSLFQPNHPATTTAASSDDCEARMLPGKPGSPLPPASHNNSQAELLSRQPRPALPAAAYEHHGSSTPTAAVHAAKLLPGQPRSQVRQTFSCFQPKQ